MYDAKDKVKNDISSPKSYSANKKNIARIIKAVGLTEEERLSSNRYRNLAYKRQIAFFIMRRVLYTKSKSTGKKIMMPYEAISEVFNRHHSTIIYGIGVVEDLYKVDFIFREDFDRAVGELKEIYNG